MVRAPRVLEPILSTVSTGFFRWYRGPLRENFLPGWRGFDYQALGVPYKSLDFPGCLAQEEGEPWANSSLGRTILNGFHLTLQSTDGVGHPVGIIELLA